MASFDVTRVKFYEVLDAIIVGSNGPHPLAHAERTCSLSLMSELSTPPKPPSRLGVLLSVGEDL